MPSDPARRKRIKCGQRVAFRLTRQERDLIVERTLVDAEIEGRLSLAIFFGAIVAWVTDHLPEGDEHTNVPCRRSPGRRRCRGDIIAELDPMSGYIVWQCPLCGDHGMIHGWEDTLWNRDGSSHPPPTAPPSTARH